MNVLPRIARSNECLPSSARLPGRPSTSNRMVVTCMAHPRRVVKVAKQIEREIGNLLTYDKVMQEAICPERKRGLDGALSAIASVTEVELTNDLQVAKVYLSIYSDELGKEAAMKNVKNLEGYARKFIGRQIRLRLTPEIRFVMDESIERTERVYKLLEQVKRIEAGEMEPPPIAIAENAYVEDSEDEEDDDFEDDGDEEEAEGNDVVDEEEEGNVFHAEFGLRRHQGGGRIDSVDLGFFDSAPKQRRKPGSGGNRKGNKTQQQTRGTNGGSKKSGTGSQRQQVDMKSDGEVNAAEVNEMLELFNKSLDS